MLQAKLSTDQRRPGRGPWVPDLESGIWIYVLGHLAWVGGDWALGSSYVSGIVTAGVSLFLLLKK